MSIHDVILIRKWLVFEIFTLQAWAVSAICVRMRNSFSNSSPNGSFQYLYRNSTMLVHSKSGQLGCECYDMLQVQSFCNSYSRLDTDQIPHYPLFVSLFNFVIQILICILSDNILKYSYSYPIGYLGLG